MKALSGRRLTALVIGLLLSAPTTVLAAGSQPDLETNPEYADDRVLVKLDDDVVSPLSDPVGEEVAGLEILEEVGQGWYAVEVPDGIDPADIAEELQDSPGIMDASVNYLFELLWTPPFTPNDPWWVGQANNGNAQWHMHRIDLQDAWQHTTGVAVQVAVLDTGLTQGLSDGTCLSPIDPYDAVNDMETSVPDPNGHGTHVAMTVAQCGGNGILGTGVAPGVELMPIDVFDGDGAPTDAIVRGIEWAVNQGVQVINMSLGIKGVTSVKAVDDAIAHAKAAGIVIVAAAGNRQPGEAGPPSVYYPANHPDVIAVGATGFSNEVTPYSARGPALEFVAPGGTESAPVWQETQPAGEAVGMWGATGTSMAAPHVAGVVALLKSAYPAASASRIRNALRCGALDLGAPGWDGDYGWGLVQANRSRLWLDHLMAKGENDCPANLAAVDVTTARWNLWATTKHAGNALSGPAGQFTYGRPGDIPMLGDWDGDGVRTPGLYRQSDGFVYLRNENSAGWAEISYYFGRSGDIPVVGDFDGDGEDSVSVYRPSDGRFYIKNEHKEGWAEYAFVFGKPGDIPFAGDWNGDEVDTVGLRRPSNGFVYLKNSNSAGWADISFFYGKAGDQVFAGDWDGDGKDSVGVYRPSTGMVYLRNKLSSGNAEVSLYVGSGLNVAAR